MFYVTAVGRVEPYHPGERWRRISKSDETGDEREEHKDDHPQDEKHPERFNILDYIKPLKEGRHKFQASLIASSVMSSPVITVPVNISLDEAEKLFHRHRFSVLPVTSKEGKIVGILSERDLFHVKEKKGKNVADVMTESVLCAASDTQLDAIAKVFLDEKIKMLPIVDKGFRVVGILTRNDILRSVIKITHLRKPI